MLQSGSPTVLCVEESHHDSLDDHPMWSRVRSDSWSNLGGQPFIELSALLESWQAMFESYGCLLRKTWSPNEERKEDSENDIEAY